MERGPHNKKTLSMQDRNLRGMVKMSVSPDATRAGKWPKEIGEEETSVLVRNDIALNWGWRPLKGEKTLSL